METKRKRREGKEFPILVYPDKCTGCRICQLWCSFRYLGMFNPLKSYIVIGRDHGLRTSSIEVTEDCTWCGECARYCAWGALVLKKAVREKKE